MKKRHFGLGKYVRADENNLAQDYMTYNIQEAVQDMSLYGIKSGGVLTQTLPLSWYISITATRARDINGNSIVIPDRTILVQPSIDPGAGNEVYVTPCVAHKYQLSELDVDTEGTSYYKDYQDSYILTLVQGTITPLGYAVKPDIPSGYLALCDVLVTDTIYTRGYVLNADIDESRKALVSGQVFSSVTVTSTGTIMGKFSAYGGIDAHDTSLVNVSDPIDDTGIGDRGYNDSRYVNISGDTMTGALSVTDFDVGGNIDAATLHISSTATFDDTLTVSANGAAIYGNVTVNDGTFWIDHDFIAVGDIYAGHDFVVTNIFSARALEVSWTTSTGYYEDEVVSYNGKFYSCINTHISSSSFAADVANWYAMGTGDMTQIQYDTNSDGTVDSSDYATSSGYAIDSGTLDGHHSSFFSSTGHLHDDRYFTEGESDIRFSSTGHLHDDRYFTEGESDIRFSSTGHIHTLDGLSDVVIATPVNEQFVIYNSSTGTWRNNSSPFGTWATSTGYTVGTIVLRNYALYRCVTNHTAGTFYTDLATNLYWQPIGSKPGDIKYSFVNTVEPGWLECNGALITAAYEDLYTICNANKYCSHLVDNGTSAQLLSTEANAYDNGHNSTNTKDKAFNIDGTTSYWESSQGGTSVSGNDADSAALGQSGLTRKVQRIRWKSHSSTNNTLDSVLIQWSSTGAAWTTIQTTGISSAASTMITIDVADYAWTSGEHWVRVRANADLSGSYKWIIPEMQMYASNLVIVDSTVIWTTATAIQSGELAFQDTDQWGQQFWFSNTWQSNTAFGSTSGAAYIGIGGMTEAVRLMRVIQGNNAIASVKIQWSADGSTNWQDIQTQALNVDALATAYGYPISGYDSLFTVNDYTPSNPYWIRLLANANPFSDKWNVGTIEMYCKTGLPDGRGVYLRGWDNGKGVDSGRNLASPILDPNFLQVATFSYPQGRMNNLAAKVLIKY